MNRTTDRFPCLILSGHAFHSLKEDTMRRFQAYLATVCVLCHLSVALAAADDPTDPTNPPKVPTGNDRTGALTERVGGKKKTTRMALKSSLGVKGPCAKEGYPREEGDKAGPAAMVSDPAGDCPM